MNRRNFTHFSIAGLLAASAMAHSNPLSKPTSLIEKMSLLKAQNGLVLKLYDKQAATANLDHKQYILTFDVFNSDEQLTEKIYHVYDQNGRLHQLFMKPVRHNQLQAVINHRTHA